MAIFAPGILPRFPRCFTAALALFNVAALITLPLALFAGPNPFDIVNLKRAPDHVGFCVSIASRCLGRRSKMLHLRRCTVSVRQKYGKLL